MFFGYVFYEVLFFAIPLLLLALCGVSIYRYISAKKKNKHTPGAFSEAEIKKRRDILIIISVVTGLMLAAALGFMALFFISIAFM